MNKQKRVAAIHDISGFGKCSLTVALPILSAAGIETSIMPTAVLSTYTGTFAGYTYRDLTSDLRPFMRHWKSLGLDFDAVYSGFLGSYEQLEIVGEFIDTFKAEGGLAVVDPVMGDNGALYSVYQPDFVTGMRKLCAKADIIVPNMTEAAMLLGMPYSDGPYEKGYIESLLLGLSQLGANQVVLTGVYLDGDTLGAACMDAVSKTVHYAFSDRVEGFFHGTGDIFASVLVAAVLNGQPLKKAVETAVDFTHGSILRTKEAGADQRFGVNFEAGLPTLMRQLGIF